MCNRMGNCRSFYGADYLVKYGSGHRYFRAVPKELRPVVGRKYWYECLGKVSRRDAQAKAVVLAARDQKIIDSLRRLFPIEREAIAQAGGLAAWLQVQQQETALAPLFQLGASLEPDPEMPDDMQDADLLAAAQNTPGAGTDQRESRAANKIVRRLGNSGGSLLTLVDLHVKVRPPRSTKTTEKARL